MRKNERPRRVIIEHAWRNAPPGHRTTYLAACILDCLKRGETPIASVATYVLTEALNDATPEERAQGIEAGLAWYQVAEACVVYQDHGISEGMQLGIDRAEHWGVPVEYRRLQESKDEPATEPAAATPADQAG